MLSEILDLHLSTIALLSIIATISTIALISWLRSLMSSPGPWGVPILGYYPFLRTDFQVQLHELTKKYGPVYIINLAGQTFLYLDTIKAVREAYVNKAEFFPSRGDKPCILHDSYENGVAFLSGEAWRVQHKFFVQSMRVLGLSRNSEELKGPIEIAVHSTLDTLHQKRGEVVELMPLMTKQCTDVVLRLVLGDGITEEEETKLNEVYLKILEPMTDLNLLLIGNIAKYLILSRIQSFKELLKSKEAMVDLLSQIVERRKANFDLNQQQRDFIGLYLQEREIRQRKGDPQAKFFTDLALVSTLIQAYGDGSVSVGVFVGMFMIEFSQRREAQDALYEEIINVVGAERLPTLEDRPLLPLTNSAIKEILRTMKQTAVIPGLECAKETTVMGVEVPKGCITLMNIWAANNDPEVHEEPERFDITRYLPNKPKVEQPVNFGIGKRACAGESLVFTEIFMFIAAVLQNFLLMPEAKDEKMDYNEAQFFETVMHWSIRAIPRPGSRYATETTDAA